MKTLLKVVLLVLLALFLVLFFFGGPVIKNSINTVGPVVLKVPVTVKDVQFYPVRGLVRIDELVVGNPDGFKTDHLFNLKQLLVRLQVRSLFTDTIVVKEVSVIGPEVTYESTLTGSNIGALQKALAGEEKEAGSEEKAPAEEPAKAETPGKKVVIEKFVFDEGLVNLSLPGMMGTAMPIPLPAIEMTDIGKDEEGGASLTDVIGEVFSAIFSAVTQVVTSSGKLIGDGAKLVGEGAVAAGGLAVDGATAAGGAAVDGAAAVGGAAVDAGKAVGRGVAAAAGGVVNLFGGSDEKKEESTEAAPAE